MTDLQGTVRDLAQKISALTKQSADEVMPFAEQYAPLYVKWATKLATAQRIGDADDVSQLTDDLADINDAAILDAADAAINLEAAGEQGLLNILNLFAQTLAKAL